VALYGEIPVRVRSTMEPMAIAPRAPSSQPLALRGDYAAVGADYLVPQQWSAYTPAEHARWRLLFERQSALLERHGAAVVRAGLARLQVAPGRIPRLETVSRRLRALTGWRLVGVPGLIPEARFFAHLAERRFPVTVWMRSAEELDYLAEPDLFHDFFGHVPLLAEPVFADFVAEYGRRGVALARRRPALLKGLARLYWYGVEFGLLRTPSGLRAFGAGILSSAAETPHAVGAVGAFGAAAPLRLAFDIDRVLRTDYLIDGFQRTYFVLDDFEALYGAIADRRFAARCEAALALPAVAPGETLAGEVPVAFRALK
jgi:phenylalanine-4-hydroxylase